MPRAGDWPLAQKIIPKNTEAFRLFGMLLFLYIKERKNVSKKGARHRMLARRVFSFRILIIKKEIYGYGGKQIPEFAPGNGLH